MTDSNPTDTSLPTPSPSSKPDPASLRYRPVTSDDHSVLTDMRIACGWGAERVKMYYTGPDFAIYLFYFEGEEEGEDRKRKEIPAAMGGLRFEDKKDSDCASRDRSIVEISSLFILQQYQSIGLGNRIMTILESIAVEKYSMKTLSLTTLPWDKLYDGSKDPDIVADFETMELSRNMKWYMRRGYEEYKPRAAKYQALNGGDDKPVYYAAYMRKAGLSTDESRRIVNGSN